MGKAEEMKASNSVWKEQLTFEKMVDELTISESMIKKATKFCIKQQKWYKHIVQVIERYALREKIRKSQKLQIFYIIDGILRRLAREKNKKLLKKFSSRFNRNIVATVTNLLAGSLPSERQKIKRVVTLWAKSVLLFSTENVKALKELVKDLPDGKSKPAAYSPRKLASKQKPAHKTPSEPSKPAVVIPLSKTVTQTPLSKPKQVEESSAAVKPPTPERELELMLKHIPSPTQNLKKPTVVEKLPTPEAPESELELMLKDIPSPKKEPWQEQSSSAKSTLDAIESLQKQSSSANSTLAAIESLQKQSSSANYTLAAIESLETQSSSTNSTLAAIESLEKQSSSANSTLAAIESLEKQSSTNSTLAAIESLEKQSSSSNSTLAAIESLEKQSSSANSTLAAIESLQKQSSSAKCTLDAIESLMLPTEVKSKPSIPTEVVNLVDDAAFDYGDNQSIEETRQSLKRKFGNSSLVSPLPKKRKSIIPQVQELTLPKPPSPRLESAKMSVMDTSLSRSRTPDAITPRKPKVIVNHPGYVIKEDDPTGTTVMSTCIWAKFSRDQTELLKGHCEMLGEVVDFHIVNDEDPSEAFISFRTRCSALFVKLHLLKGNDPGCNNRPRLMKVGWGKTPGVIDFDFAKGIGKVTAESKPDKPL